MNRRNFQCTGNFIKIKNKLQRIESKVQLSLTNAVLKNKYLKIKIKLCFDKIQKFLNIINKVSNKQQTNPKTISGDCNNNHRFSLLLEQNKSI